ncbi:MAG TPA: SpoIIE family protein phosphatase, partial [Bacteroidia bacterium]
GAFMSLLNISYLNEAVSENVMTEPGKVFDHVRNKLIANVSHGTERQDGMDGILLCMESNASGKYVKLKYAAAYNVPLLIRNNEVIALKADKMPVGKGEKTEPFNSYEVELQSGDILYIYTDGYADQFGGPKGKKFKYKQLEELLISVNHLPMNEQSELLRETIEKWRGELEQVDDVLIAGIKF